MDIDKLAQSILKKHMESVVMVRMKPKVSGLGSGLGTGFVIRSTSTSCLVMTCEHVIRDFDESKHTLCVRFCGQSLEYPAERQHYNSIADLAIIRVKDITRMYPALKFRDANDVPPRTDVFLLGYIFLAEGKIVLPLAPGISPGKTTAPLQEVEEGVMDVVFTSSAVDGSSGSPVILGDGVIGVNRGAVFHLMHATSSDSVNFLLKRWLHISEDDTRTYEELINELQI